MEKGNLSEDLKGVRERVVQVSGEEGSGCREPQVQRPWGGSTPDIWCVRNSEEAGGARVH